MNELPQLLEQLQARDDPANEETAKFTILQPILQAIGWNTHDTTEVMYEHPVGRHRSDGRVDIALKGGTQRKNSSQKRIVALIEAKAPSEDLGKHVSQVLGYAFHEGCDICVLTNGIEWWLFLPRESGSPLDRRFTTLNLKTTPTEQLAEDFEAFLSKENLINGLAFQQAKRVLKAHQTKALLEAVVNVFAVGVVVVVLW